MMENGFLYVCMWIYMYIYPYSVILNCVSVIQEKRLYVACLGFFSLQISEQLGWMEQEKHVCYFGISTYVWLLN